MTLIKWLFTCAVALSITVIGSSALAGAGDVALTRADPSCEDTTSPDIYFDCGNGTVTDGRSGLTWLKNIGCLTMGTGGPSLAKLTWDRATIEAHNLSHGVCGLSDSSTAGDWRIATKEEWTRMLADAITLGCTVPALTNAKGDECHDIDPIFTNICGGGDNGSLYWTTTSVTGVVNTHAALKELFDGSDVTRPKTEIHCLWPVRLSQGEGD